MSQQQDLLVPVRAVLSSAERWTKGTYARTAEGAVIRPDAPTAVCWCVLGAISRAYPLKSDSSTRIAISAALYARAGITAQGISGWQDAKVRTFEDVQALLAEPVYLPTQVTA